MREWLLFQTGALACGVLIDFFVGDPHCIPHPVCLIGNFISLLDRRLRRGVSAQSDLGRGVLTVALVLLFSAAIPALLLLGTWRLSPWLCFAVNSVMCAQILAARQLVRESRSVQRALEAGDVEGARYAVSMIVGRDTDALDGRGVCRAAVETVAENTSDGVIAPMLWMLLFGAAGGFFYKAANTMDSMLGYKNEKYLYFGRAAAKTDDFVNYIPARVSAWLMIAAAPLCGLDAKNALRIFRRDRYKHASPNSAQTESVCAGALGVRLAGDAYYGGVLHPKETIGDAQREIEPRDIARAGRLMYAALFLLLPLGLAVRTGVILLCF